MVPLRHRLVRCPAVRTLWFLTVLASASGAAAQGASGPGLRLAEGLDKWLGNVYSPFQVEAFTDYWNQVVPENAGKWGSVEAVRDQMDWARLDAAYALAKDSGFVYRHHVLIWGRQQPEWISALPPGEQLAEVEEWFQAVADRYPDIDYLEVVNEPLPGHGAPDGEEGRADYVDALGGPGATGWDWLITAFSMARDIFPATTRLMLNDYAVLSRTSTTKEYVEIIELLQDRGLIDAIGVQGHAFSTRPGAPIEEALDILGATGLPVVVTEMDIDGNPEAVPISEAESDQNQLEAMQRVFPTVWEHPAVVGVTMWGWRPGLWRTEEEAYLVRENGEPRPALVWLAEYLDGFRPAVAAETVGDPRTGLWLDAHPSPFAGSTRIGFRLPEAADVTLTVHDVTGRVVATLAAGARGAGAASAWFDASGLPAGLYLVRLEAAGDVVTRRVVLIR